MLSENDEVVRFSESLRRAPDWQLFRELELHRKDIKRIQREIAKLHGDSNQDERLGAIVTCEILLREIDVIVEEMARRRKENLLVP